VAILWMYQRPRMRNVEQNVSFSDLVTNLWYGLRGRHVPLVGLHTFGPGFAAVMQAMIPTYEIIRSAKIDLQQEWTPAMEQEIINAHVNHLMKKWQPAHNSLNRTRPEKRFQKLHRKAMLASRAYGETIMTYVEYRRLFLSPLYLTKTYNHKQRDGEQWDRLAVEHLQILVGEIHRLQAEEPQAFKLLVPSDTIVEDIESIDTVSIWIG